MNIQSTVTFLLLALWSCIALAQELVPQESDVPTKLPPTADSVIARFVEAKGGKEKLSSILSYSLSGVIEIVNEDEREEIGEFQIYQTDGQSLTRITLPDSSVMSHGTDGKIAWSISEHGTASILKGQEAHDYIRHHKTLHGALAWPEQFETIKCVGDKTIDGNETRHLIFIESSNRQINRYFSVDTGLLIREEQFVGSNNSLQISEISDYQRCPKGTMVSRVKTNSGDRQGAAKMKWRIKNVSSNDDGIQKHLQLPEPITKLLIEKTAK